MTTECVYTEKFVCCQKVYYECGLQHGRYLADKVGTARFLSNYLLQFYVTYINSDK